MQVKLYTSRNEPFSACDPSGHCYGELRFRDSGGRTGKVVQPRKYRSVEERSRRIVLDHLGLEADHMRPDNHESEANKDFNPAMPTFVERIFALGYGVGKLV